MLHRGDDLELKSSTDLAEAQLEATNSVGLDTSIDHDKIVIKLQDYSQGMDFDVIVASGSSTEGAPLAPVDVHVTTPAPLDPPLVRPGGGAAVSPTTHPTVTFAAPVADPDAALNAIDVEPSIKGEWRWTAPNRAELVPNNRLPVLTSYKIIIHGGPDGPQPQDGGYLEDDVVSTFQTTHDKLIDVSLAGQVVTLIQKWPRRYAPGRPTTPVWRLPGRRPGKLVCRRTWHRRASSARILTGRTMTSLMCTGSCRSWVTTPSTAPTGVVALACRAATAA